MAIGTIATIGAIAAGAGAAAKGISGASQVRRGKRALREAEKLNPGYQIPKEFEENLAKSENMARTGLPSQEYNLATTNIQRETQAGLRQLGRMSNPFAGIAGLARSQSDSLGRLDAANAQARRQNMLQAMGARRELAGQKLAAQQYQQQRYFDAVNQSNALIGAGRQNVSGAFNAVGNIGLGLIGASQGGGQQTMGQIYNQPQVGNVSGAGVTYSGGMPNTKSPFGP
jgi:hypothetical protein